MTYAPTPDNVAVLQQTNAANEAFVDLRAPAGKTAALRLFQGDLQRAEFRNVNGTVEIVIVDTQEVETSVLSAGATGTLTLPNLAVAPGPSIDLVVDGAGNIFKQSSSLRYKENVRPLTEDFAKAMALRPISFTAKGGGVAQIGYAAEDVAEAGLDHLVTRDAEGRPEAVSYKHLGIYALELIKRQAETIGRQQARIDALEDTLARIEAKLAV